MYVMSWSELGAFYTCGGGSVAASDPHGPGGLPGPKSSGLPGNVVAEDPAFWPAGATGGVRDGPAGAAPGTAAKMGQVSSVARAGDGAAWVLRRGPRAWDAAAFSGADGRDFTHKEPISDEDSSLLMRVDQDTGEVLQKCGGDKSLPFWMPHMVSPNRDGSVWVTDAGAHTATKLGRDCAVLQRLGEQGVPGSGPSNFCKPTRAIELGDGGDVLVADGYCNARVARFSKAGVFQGEYDLRAHEARFPAPGVRVHFLFHFFSFFCLFLSKRSRHARHKENIKNSPFLLLFLPFPITTKNTNDNNNRRETARTSPTTSPSTSASGRCSSPTASTGPCAASTSPRASRRACGTSRSMDTCTRWRSAPTGNPWR